MNETLYRILENGKEIAVCHGLDMAFAFVKGYRDTYFHEVMYLTIAEVSSDEDNE